MKQYTGKTVEEVKTLIAKENDCEESEIVIVDTQEKKHLLGIGNTVTVEAYTPKDIKEFIFDYLGSYFEELNQGVSIEIIIDRKEEITFRVILDAENNAIIIGKNGQTLRAINQVLRAAVNATFKRRVNVIIDINHYREDRYKKVKIVASKVAREVAKTHVDAALDPMPNDERKVIHQYLQANKHVQTVSEGEGEKRHIIIKYVENEAK